MDNHFPINCAGVFLLLICLVGGVGCATIRHLDELLVLKHLGDNQREAELYLKKQEALFAQLCKDVKEGKLQEGVMKKEILSRYGEPILTKEGKDSSADEVLLYRHPTNYFSSDKIYLHFNSQGKLSSWVYQHHKKPATTTDSEPESK